jgi:3',5'-cyclic AMP phosphodiesterase CpdA
MVAIIDAKRQQQEFVTIVHLSDLHFPPRGATPRLAMNPDAASNWERLIADIADQKPDLLCVTGDLADNPCTDLIRQIGRVKPLLRKAASVLGPFFRDLRDNSAELAQWSNSMADTFDDVLRFLHQTCREAGLDPAVALHVVPGNHDLRLQGFIVDEAAMLIGENYAEIPRNLFAEKFAPYFRNASIAFGPPDGTADPASAIVTSIVGLDSNAEDIVASFATGGISDEELRKLQLAFERPAGGPWEAATEHRVCLIHHHPLPVASSERPIDSARTREKDDTIGNLREVLEGEQTTLLKNAGTFLDTALRAGVGLVLHGHHHRSWYTHVRYPAEGAERRLLVAAAGSIGEITDNGCRYNVIRLYANGNITVEERGRQRVLPVYLGETRLQLYTPDELRIVRRNALLAQLKDTPANRHFPELPFGIAHADQYVRQTEIHHDGSATITITITNLRAAPGVKKVEWLLITSRLAQGAYTDEPKRKPIFNPHQYRVDVAEKASADGRSRHWALEFEPPLSADRPVTLVLTYRAYNTFDFVKEYRRAREPNCSEEESTAFSPRAVLPERLIVTVSFPDGWAPESAPYLQVLNHHEECDEDEQRYHESSLDYVPRKGVASISVVRPLPGYAYKVSWPLDRKIDYERKRYDEDLLKKARALRQRAVTPSHCEAITSLLQEVRAHFSGAADSGDVPTVNEHTEFSLFVAREKEEGSAKSPATRAWLERACFLGADDSPAIDMVRHETGQDLAGLAHRSGVRQAMYRGDELAGYVGRQDARSHVALWCFPLTVPAMAGSPAPHLAPGVSRSPVYAVLCVGSYIDDGSLDRACVDDFEKYLRNTMNRRIFEALMRRPAIDPPVPGKPGPDNCPQ